MKYRQNEKIPTIVYYRFYLMTKNEVHKLYFLCLSGLRESESFKRAYARGAPLRLLFDAGSTFSVRILQRIS